MSPPTGTRLLADAAHESGSGLVAGTVRLRKGIPALQNHPDWLLQVDGQPSVLRAATGAAFALTLTTRRCRPTSSRS